MLAIPDRLAYDQERRCTTITVARRHLGIVGLGALLEPVLRRGKQRDVIIRRAHNVALVVRREAGATQEGADLRIVPEFLGKTRVTPSASGAGRIICFTSAKLCCFLPKNLLPNVAAHPMEIDDNVSNVGGVKSALSQSLQLLAFGRLERLGSTIQI